MSVDAVVLLESRPAAAKNQWIWQIIGHAAKYGDDHSIINK